MFSKIINVLSNKYDCKFCGRMGFDSADMPSHASSCRSKVAILIALPRKYVVLLDGTEFKQFQLEFENIHINIFFV